MENSDYLYERANDLLSRMNERERIAKEWQLSYQTMSELRFDATEAWRRDSRLAMRSDGIAEHAWDHLVFQTQYRREKLAKFNRNVFGTEPELVGSFKFRIVYNSYCAAYPMAFCHLMAVIKLGKSRRDCFLVWLFEELHEFGWKQAPVLDDVRMGFMLKNGPPIRRANNQTVFEYFSWSMLPHEDAPRPENFSYRPAYWALERFENVPGKQISDEIDMLDGLVANSGRGFFLLKMLPTPLLFQHAWAKDSEALDYVLHTPEGVLDAISNQRLACFFPCAMMEAWPEYIKATLFDCSTIRAHGAVMLACLGRRFEFEHWWSSTFSQDRRYLLGKRAFKWIRTAFLMQDPGVMELIKLPFLSVKARVAAFCLWYRPGENGKGVGRTNLFLSEKLETQGKFGNFVKQLFRVRKDPGSQALASEMYPPEDPWIVLWNRKARVSQRAPAGASVVDVNLAPGSFMEAIFDTTISKTLGMTKQTNASALSTIAAYVSVAEQVFDFVRSGKFVRALRLILSSQWLASKHGDVAGRVTVRLIHAMSWWKRSKRSSIPYKQELYSDYFDNDLPAYEQVVADLEEESVRAETDFGLETQTLPVGEIFQSDLGMKFMAMLGALSLPEVVVKFPGALKNLVMKTCEFWSTCRTYESVTTKVWSFFSALFSRCKEFMETWDVRCFLSDSRIDTYVKRCIDVMGSHVKDKPSRWLDIEEQIETAKALIDEGNVYMKKDNHRAWKCFTPAHHRVFFKLDDCLREWNGILNSTAYRARAPFSTILLGPAGTGKTALCDAVGQYFIDRVRNVHSTSRAISGSDIYTVPIFDPHWNNCSNPSLLIWNDLPGNGYNVNNLCIPDMLRMSVDRCPFFTPQASIPAKERNTIDPAAVMVSSNAMVWDFKVWGTDWAKLLRRYKHIYYFDYPESCYDGAKLKDPTIECDAELAPQMRIFRAIMTHDSGIIRFVKHEQVATGLEELEIIIKKAFNAHLEKKEYDSKEKACCCVKTSIEYHVLKKVSSCMPGCNYAELIAQKEVDGIEAQCGSLADVVSTSANELNGTIEGIVQNAADSVLERADAVLESVNRELSAAQEIREEIGKTAKNFGEWMGVAGKIVAALTVAIGVFAGIRMLTSSSKEKETSVRARTELATEVLSGTMGNVEAQAIKNPASHDFDFSLAARLGLVDAVKREMDGPPSFPVNERAHMTFSTHSATTSISDLRGLMLKSEVKISVGEYEVFGSFIQPSVLAVNNHGYQFLRDKGTWRVNEKGCSHKMEFVPGKVWVCKELDLVLMKTSPFFSSNLVPHFPIAVGVHQQVSLDKGYTFVDAVRKNLDARKAGMEKDMDSLKYPSTYVKGDCGKLIMGSVNGRPLIFGMHMAGIPETKVGFCSVITQEILDKGIKELFGEEIHLESLFVSYPYVDLGPLHSNSKFRTGTVASPFETCGSGKLQQKQADSRIIPTKLHSVAVSRLSELRVIPNLKKHGVKSADGTWFSPTYHKLKGFSLRCSNPDLRYVDAAIEDYLHGAPRDKLHPLNLHQAIAGVPGDPLLKHINLNTSPGIYGKFYGSKANLVDLLKIDPDLKNHIERAILRLILGGIVERQTWALKDEVVTWAKEQIKKYRYFMVSDFHNLLLFRMFVAPLVAHMYRYKEFYEAYGAFNPASLEFGRLIDQLKVFKFLLEADMKHMDTSHKSFMAEAVAKVFAAEARAMGYNREAVLVTYHLVVSIVFSVVELDADVVAFNEGMGSGVYITFIFNCICLSIMYRVAWFKLGHTTRFREQNKLVAGGDDSVATTNSERFTQPAIAEVFLEYGYELSPPTDKTGKLKNFYSWDELVFLKRSPSTLSYGGKQWVVGKLEADSIWKSLGFWLKDGQISELDRMAQVLDAAQREFALHGRDRLEEFQYTVRGVYPYVEKSFDEIMSKYVIGKLYEGVLTFIIEKEDSAFDAGFGCVEPSKFNPSDIMVTAAAGEANAEERLMLETQSDNFLFRLGQQVSQTGEKVHGPTSSLVNKSISNALFESSGPSIQKGTVDFNLVSDLVGNAPPQHYKAENMRAMKDVSIQEYLHRPVHCGSFTWSSTTPLVNASVCLPYNEWINNPRVADKLDGYKFWRAKPKLRFVVNGFAFYYGRLHMTAFPTPGFNGLQSQPTTSRYLNSVNQSFQMPHVSIDPSLSQTYDLDLPWYSARDWYDMTLTVSAEDNPEIELGAAVISPLQSANTTPPTDVTIQIYVIMSEVELTIPCSYPTTEAARLQLQGVTAEADEKTPVADATATMATAMGALAKIPSLSTWASPLAGGLGVASSIARWLGYGKPVHVASSLMSFQPIENMSLMNGRSEAVKIAGDEMAEMGVSCQIPGIGSDEDMVLANVISRPGLVSIITWTAGITLIGEANVNPVVVEQLIGATSPEILRQPTPLGWISNLFHFWTGSIIYDIEVVCSGFHRGTLGVSWLPFGTTPPGSFRDYPNTFMSQVIDIAATRKISFEVPWGRSVPWEKTGNDNRRNGSLIFYEINTLKAVTPTAVVQIVVTHRAGHDFDLSKITMENVKEWRYLERTIIPPPAAALLAEEVRGLETQADFSGEELAAGPGQSLVQSNDHRARGKVFFGEKYLTIKQIMNRYSLSGTPVSPAGISATDLAFSVYLPTIPDSRIAVYDPLTTQTPCMGLHNFFPPAFLAFRGGIRHKILKRAPISATATLGFRVYAHADYDPTINWVTVPVNSFKEMQEVSAQGGALFENNIKAASELEFPFTHALRFVDPRVFWRAFLSTDYHPALRAVFSSPSVTAALPISVFTAAGDDVSMHYFFCVPTIYRNTPPA